MNNIEFETRSKNQSIKCPHVEGKQHFYSYIVTKESNGYAIWCYTNSDFELDSDNPILSKYCPLSYTKSQCIVECMYRAGYTL